jgi:hypothetical protein
MARVGRLAGAILVEAGGDYWLVGNPKEPCDWGAHGLEAPPEIDAVKSPAIRLQRSGDVRTAGPRPAPSREVGPCYLHGPQLAVEMDGEALARALGRRMLIERNGAVSERLWRLALGLEDGRDVPSVVPAQWIVEVPDAVWRVVRDGVLRCL